MSERKLLIIEDEGAVAKQLISFCAVKISDSVRIRPWIPYVAPFALFMLFTGIGHYLPAAAHLIYAAKTITVGLLLFLFRDAYRDDLTGRLDASILAKSAAAGLFVLAVWILSDDLLPTLDTPSGFNPGHFGLSAGSEMIAAGFRILGAAAVVPIMEELFWRSFFMRYLINADFQAVPLGAFTWFSFTGVTLLFGLEHYRIIQGIIAGVVYGLLVIRRKDLKGAVLAHSITNLGLGIYVLATGNWNFW